MWLNRLLIHIEGGARGNACTLSLLQNPCLLFHYAIVFQKNNFTDQTVSHPFFGMLFLEAIYLNIYRISRNQGVI